MFQVNVTDNPIQDLTLILPDSSLIQLEIRFIPMQYSWVLNSLTYGSFQLSGRRIVTSPNFLNQYSSIIPFGMACYTAQLRDPQLQKDFSLNNFQLYVLSQDEVYEYINWLSGGR